MDGGGYLMWPLARQPSTKKTKSSGRRGAKQARSLIRRRRLSLFLRGTSVAMICAGIVASVYIWQTGLFRQWLLVAGDNLDRQVTDAGFAVRKLRITGQKNTDLKQIRAALDIRDGQSMTSLDLKAMLGRLEGLPWVKTATISKIMPDQLRVTIREHEAAALWQEQGKFHLINRTGEIITDQGLKKYPGLPQIVGSGANEHLGELLAMKQKHPRLFFRVKSSVRVGNRRWDLNCTNGIRIKLPENGQNLAWDKLYDYQRKQKILAREILVVDLRVAGKMIVRLAPREAERRRLMINSARKQESI